MIGVGTTFFIRFPFLQLAGDGPWDTMHGKNRKTFFYQMFRI